MQFTGWIDITGLVQVADMECFKRIIIKVASTLLQNKSKFPTGKYNPSFIKTLKSKP